MSDEFWFTKMRQTSGSESPRTDKTSMLPNRWFWRLCIICGGAMFVGGSLLVWLLSGRLRERLETNSHARLEAAAEHAADAVTTAGARSSALDRAKIVRAIARRHGMSGEWLAPGAIAQARGSGGTESAGHEGSSFWTAVDPQSRIESAHFTRAMRLGSEVIGGIHVSLSLEDVEAGRKAVIRSVAWGFALISIGPAFIAWLMFRGVSRKTAELETAVRAIASGNLDAEVAEDRNDEFGRLATRFNEMAAAVKDRFHQQAARSLALEERQEFLEAVLATMIEAVVAVDGNQRILFANLASRKLLGMSHTELVGRPIWEVARSPILQETLQKVLTENAEQRIEFPLPRTKRIVILAAGRLPGTPPPGAVLVLHDVTELRRLENLRRDFVSNVSHELKTPLTSIQAYADTLLEGGLDDASHNREFVQRICEAAERLHALIQNVLSLARIEAEEQVFELQPVSLRETANACIREHAAVAEAKSLRLIVEHAAADLHVLADEEGLRTILDNLLDNALNYTPAGGTVTLRYRDAGDAVQIEVADTGIGIPREHRDRIFERFYRVDRARSRELGGTGLGLSIVKHLALAYDGSVSVESRPEHGSTFTVRLPRVLTAEETNAGPSGVR
jgi:two-component system, OmpR family, phosphate regulon sensor histidine kinase PhoR